MTPEVNVPLQACNSFGIVAKARRLVRVRSAAEVQQALAGGAPAEGWFVLGGGSNIVLTGDVKPTVLKVEISGRRVVAETERHWVVEAGGGVDWHQLVAWTLDQGYPGLENLALIPGTVGASPVQNIGAYGVELQDRFHVARRDGPGQRRRSSRWTRRGAPSATATRCSSMPRPRRVTSAWPGGR